MFSFKPSKHPEEVKIWGEFITTRAFLTKNPHEIGYSDLALAASKGQRTALSVWMRLGNITEGIDPKSLVKKINFIDAAGSLNPTVETRVHTFANLSGENKNYSSQKLALNALEAYYLSDIKKQKSNAKR